MWRTAVRYPTARRDPASGQLWSGRCANIGGKYRARRRRAFFAEGDFLRASQRLCRSEDRMMGLAVGKVYRLRFPGIAVRVIEPPARNEASRYPYLVESLFLRSRWWVNELGEPDNIYSPRLIIPRSHDDAGCPLSDGK